MMGCWSGGGGRAWGLEGVICNWPSTSMTTRCCLWRASLQTAEVFVRGMERVVASSPSGLHIRIFDRAAEGSRMWSFSFDDPQRLCIQCAIIRTLMMVDGSNKPVPVLDYRHIKDTNEMIVVADGTYLPAAGGLHARVEAVAEGRGGAAKLGHVHWGARECLCGRRGAVDSDADGWRHGGGHATLG